MAKEIESKKELFDAVMEWLSWLAHEDSDAINDYQVIYDDEEVEIILHNGKHIFLKLTDPLEAK